MHLRRFPFARPIVVVLVIALASIWVFRALFGVPDSRAEAESHLERPLLAYEVWDEKPVAVFEIDQTGKIYIDRLRLDPIAHWWPPTPRWQWTGNWSYVDVSSDPASVGYGWGDWGAAFFGQVTDPEIVSIRCQMETYLLEEPVATPGYAIKLPPGEDPPATCNFLDATGAVVWTAPVSKSEV